MNNKVVSFFALALTALTIVAIPLSAQVTITDTHEGGKPVPMPAPFNMKSATQAQTASRRPAAAQHQNSGGMLLGNRNSTLLGNKSAATATSSNGGAAVSLNPQPLPPRTGKTLLGDSGAANGASTTAGTSRTTTQMKLQSSRTTSARPAQTKSATGTPRARANTSASPQ